MGRYSGSQIVLYSTVLLLVAMAGQTMAATLIPAGSVWSYLDTGVDQGTEWRTTDFVDSGWASGPAELGYGDGDEATVVSFGGITNDRHRTTYFRHTFDVPDASVYSSMTFNVKYDDGIVVYLNGSELFRENMPGGTITYGTFALEIVNDGEFPNPEPRVMSSSKLVSGDNVLAVEIHQVNSTSNDISLDLSLDASPAQIQKGPYLIYPGNNTEMMVLWQMDAPASHVLRWGQDGSYSDGSATPAMYGDDQYKHTITGLTPGVKYYYEVEGAGSGSFIAAPPGNATDVKFLAFGDTRTNPGTHDAVNAAMIDAYSSDPAYQTFTVLSGDWVNNGDSESDWTNQFFDPETMPSVREMHANLPTNGCIGNHEGSGNLYDKYWPYPYEDGGRYWSFDYGPAHVAVIVLTSEPSGTLGAAQRAWLEADLAASTKEWKFLQFHAPVYSAGKHVNNTAEQSFIQNLCVTYGVDVVFNGHNHYYSRCDVNGVQHITTGGGGAPLNPTDASYPYVVRVSSVNHFCKIDIHGSQLDLEAVTIDGTVIDSFTLTHINDTMAPTPDPMTWESVPEGTSYDSVSMTASTASDDNYDVQYYFECTAGGGNDSGWQSSPTYVDTGLDFSTQYSYRVKARDMSSKLNETGYSSAESATTHPPDLLAPRPNPTTWALHPEISGVNSILMAVIPATDPAGVEYSFECTAGGGNNSGWQDSNEYEDTGLLENTVYTYRVKARDKSPTQNETVWSYEMSARTDINFPDPGDFNKDGFVNILDLGLFGQQWSLNGCGLDDFWCNFADMDLSAGVDADDLIEFSSHWLQEYLPPEFEMDFDDFESYPTGTIIGSQPDWYLGDSQEVANVGVGGSQGLRPFSNFLVWSAGDGSINGFNWAAAPPEFPPPDNILELALGDTLVFSMDFMFGSSAQGFEQESVGFTIFPFSPYYDMDLSFNISLDDIPEGGYGIEASWFTQMGENPTITIAPIPDPTVGTWYRLRAAFTKLTESTETAEFMDGSLSIDAQVWQLDAAGNKVSLFGSGSIADTSAFGDVGPHPAYFYPWYSDLTLWPVFRNPKGFAGGADNAYFGYIPAEEE